MGSYAEGEIIASNHDVARALCPHKGATNRFISPTGSTPSSSCSSSPAARP